MLTQVNFDGFSLTLMEGIVDYKRDDLIATPKTENTSQLEEAKENYGKQQRGGSCW